MAVFGFLLKEVFLDPNAPQPTAVRWYGNWAILLFGVRALATLVFRYWSAESLRLYIEALRYKTAEQQANAASKLVRRRYSALVCIFAKAFAAAALAVGAVFIVFALIATGTTDPGFVSPRGKRPPEREPTGPADTQRVAGGVDTALENVARGGRPSLPR